MGYIIRKFDKKEFWSEYANRFIPLYMKYPLTVFDTLEEAKEFASINTQNIRKPLFVCDLEGKIIR